MAGTTACAVSGATAVLPSASFEPKAVMEAIDQERCSVVYGVPAMFIAELQHPEFHNYRFDSLRTGYAGHGPQVMATLRNMAISLLRIAGITQIARTLQAFSRDRTRILSVIPL